MVIGDAAGIVVSSVTYDHRDVHPGALHCCLPGDHLDGHDFASLRPGAPARSPSCASGRSATRPAGAVQLVVGEPAGPPGDGARRLRALERPGLVAAHRRGDRHERQDDDDLLPPLGVRGARLAHGGDRHTRGPADHA